MMTQGAEDRNGMNMNPSKESIHSGHFMVSDIDDSEVQDDDDTVSVPISEGDEQERQPPPKGFDFESAMKQTSKTYSFGPRSCKSVSIDATLTKLFQCMTLAYRGKLTSPRWKNFKGLKLRWKDKIRVNNVIWRAWHMQFVERRNTCVCQFQSPLDTEAHIKPEAVVLEGKYWKRQLDAVRAEYKSWRLFTQKFPKGQAAEQQMMADYNYEWQPRSNQSAYSCSMIVDDDPFNEFNDAIFSCLIPNQPFAFPNPREIARAGIADFIQPGLLPFQPNLDECMDTLDWFSDFYSARLPPVVEESENNVLSDLLDGATASAPAPTTTSPVAATLPQQNGSEYLGLNMLMEGSQAQTVTTQRQRRTQQVVSSVSSSREEPMYRSKAYNGNVSVNDETIGLAPLISGNDTYSGLGACGVDRKRSTDTSSQLIEQTQHPRLEEASLEQQHGSRVAPHGLFAIGPSSATALPMQRQTSDCLFVSPEAPSSHAQPTDTQQQNLQLPLPSSSHQVHGSPPSTTITPQVAVQPLLNTSPQPQAGPTSPPGQLINHQTALRTFADILPRYSPPYVDQHSSLQSASTTTRSSTLPSTLPPLPPVVTTTNGAASGRRLSIDRDKEKAHGEKDDVFLVPKPKQRLRSRSGPSLGQLLTQSSKNTTPVATVTSAASTSAIHLSTSVVPQQSALLAQLLSTGTYSTNDKLNTSKNSSQTAVTILPNCPSTQAVVITPVTLATMTSVNDLQSRVLVGATNQVFGGLSRPLAVPPPGKVALPPVSATTALIPSASTPNLNCQPSQELSGKDGDPLRTGSPPKPFRPKSETERVQYREHRRVCHINAEQKRRCNIKNGFDTLHHLVPGLAQNPNGKVSKAAMLQKAGEYITQLKAERSQLQEEATLLKKQIDGYNRDINLCQSQLPATGAPVPCQRPNKIQKMFQEYVRNRTSQNWKFWIFSILVQPLLESYNSTVSTANVDELCKTVLTWLEQHCSLVALRPGVFNSLRHLSTTTNILSDPRQIQEEARRAVRL